MSRRKRLGAILSILALGLFGLPFLPGWYWSLRTDNPVRRGAALAQSQGCFSCHRPLGSEETKNPGSRWGTIPSFFGGNSSMYVKEASQVRNWIAYGKRVKGASHHEDGEPAHEEGTQSSLDRETPAHEGKEHPFHMVAFGPRLSSKEIDELAAFVLAADGYLVPMEGPVSEGFTLSRRWGCEGCHGVGGAGGNPNPHSFTGFVPGFKGAAFNHLTQNKEEFSEWVKKGRSDRFAKNKPASYFLNRANLHMPKFENHLKESEVEALWSYVQWLRGISVPQQKVNGNERLERTEIIKDSGGND